LLKRVASWLPWDLTADLVKGGRGGAGRRFTTGLKTPLCNITEHLHDIVVLIIGWVSASLA